MQVMRDNYTITLNYVANYNQHLVKLPMILYLKTKLFDNSVNYQMQSILIFPLCKGWGILYGITGAFSRSVAVERVRFKYFHSFEKSP